MFTEVNYLAIGVAAVAHFVIGAMWYTAIFGKMWLKLVDPDGTKAESMKSGQAMAFIGSFSGSLLMSYAVARLMGLIGVEGIFEALVLAVLVWVGFTLPLAVNDAVYEKRPWALIWINTLYILVGIIVATLILFYWK